MAQAQKESAQTILEQPGVFSIKKLTDGGYALTVHYTDTSSGAAEKVQVTINITETMFNKFKQALAGENRITLRKDGTTDAFKPAELAKALIENKFTGDYNIGKAFEDQAMPRGGSPQLKERLRAKLRESELYKNTATALTEWFKQLAPKTQEKQEEQSHAGSGKVIQGEGFRLEIGNGEAKIFFELDERSRSTRAVGENGEMRTIQVLPPGFNITLNQFVVGSLDDYKQETILSAVESIVLQHAFKKLSEEGFKGNDRLIRARAIVQRVIGTEEERTKIAIELSSELGQALQKVSES